ncbi:zinc finger protein 300-like [Hyperolius riggenbachi]|uniref:zinc finger protein 300-like n=1 Tax=Hyperolius riggenbachi TaxID=752182 RepID=UPI0035A2DCAA
MAMSLSMDEDWNRVTDRIINLTMEIIHLLTGQIFPPVKPGDRVTIVVPSTHSLIPSLIPKRCNKQKILEVTNKIIDLLMGEEDRKPLEGQEDKKTDIVEEIRQEKNIEIQDQKISPHHQGKELAAINITVKKEIKNEDEEDEMKKEQNEEHNDIYKDTMMENQLPLISLDGSSNRNSPERFTGPLYSQDCTQEVLTIPHHYQRDDHLDLKIEIKEEEEDMWESDGVQSTEEGEMITVPVKQEAFPLDINTDGRYVKNSLEGHLILPPEDNGATQCSLGGNPSTQYMYHRTKRENTINLAESSPNMSAGATLRDSDITPNELDHRFASTSCFVGLQCPDQPQFSCQECGKSCQTESEYILHQRSHTSSEETLSCSECEKLLTTRADLIPATHQADHSGEGVLSCYKCGQCFMHRGNCEKAPTGEKPFPCPECGKCFGQRQLLLTHQKIHTGERRFSCSDCGKAFLRNSDLLKHQKIHTGERPYSCSECGKRFIQKTGLVIHQKKHTGERPFECSQCGKSFTVKSHYFKHLQSHTGERPYSCAECGKRFSQKGNLNVHKRIHSGERRFMCAQCGKSFTEKQHLFKHEQAHHTRVRPFTCSQCGKGFISTGDLRRHERTHTGERPFSCATCGKSFTKKDSLLRHQQSHPGERPFICSECGKGFVQKKDLVKHQTIHTSMQDVVTPTS